MDFTFSPEMRISMSALSLLSQEDEFDQDVSPLEIMTPSRKVKVINPPLDIDEDSGLGMEFDSRTPTDTPTSDWFTSRLTPNNHVETPASGSSVKSFRLKRCLLDGDDDGSITKKRRGSGPRRLRKGIMEKKSLSFGDQPFLTEVSESDVTSVVEKFVQEDNLIGNGSQSFCLPTIPGKHSDLKSITPETMADVLKGKYDDVINSCRIIDCRYPFEYTGGHIQGAENLYTRELVSSLLQSEATSHQKEKRDILVFHCEFSSERGPKMIRFLRSMDREMNKANYPFLKYPEVYLLHDGYKAFYETNKAQCEPMNYTPMLHTNHTEDLRHFRAKSKSWCTGDKRRRAPNRLCF